MNSASDQILELAERIRSYQAKGIDKTLSEQDTKALLVEPLLKMAGWDVADPTQVSREDRPTERPVDYSLKLEGKPKVLVECKRLSNRLDSRRDLEQALAYAAAAGVKWCVLTNGSLVRIYNSLAPEVAKKKLLEELDLSKAGTAEGLSTERVMELLRLISPQSVGSGEIDRVWDRRYTGVKIKGVVEELLAGPDRGWVSLVRRRMKESGRAISNQEAMDWLKMLDIRVRMRPLKPVPAPPTEGADYYLEYHLSRADNPAMRQLMKDLVQGIRDLDQRIKVSLTKSHILFALNRGFVWLEGRKTSGPWVGLRVDRVPRLNDPRGLFKRHKGSAGGFSVQSPDDFDYVLGLIRQVYEAESSAAR